MIEWNDLLLFAVISIVFWFVASIFSLLKKQTKSKTIILYIFQLSGIFCLTLFIIFLSIRLKRPPIKTMGEVRLWYALFLPVVGLITYRIWHFTWILLYTTILSSVFLIINMLHSEIHNQSLMPALQSIWFIPHVVIYMFSYALLGCSFIIACVGLIKKDSSFLLACDKLVFSGIALFTVAMLLGSIWAKSAWGNYWTWDEKEIWVAITWMSYLFYLHLRNYKIKHNKFAYIVLLFSFVCLQMCWYGITLFPSLRESLHAYF